MKKAYNLPTMNMRKAMLSRRRLLLAGLAAVGIPLALLLGPGVLTLLVPLAFLYLGVRLVTGPLPGLIARIRLSIRWKILAAVSLLAGVSILATIVNVAAMDYMHTGLHEVQELWYPDRLGARLALDDLEGAQHGPFFSLLPLLSLLAALLALGLGVAIAVSVTQPVQRMREGMRRIASGDLSQPIAVANRDELGELAERINTTAQELARLQEAALAEERSRALRERVAQVTLAQEEERRRISRELHDGLGPSLAALANRLRACQRLLRSQPDQAEREMEEITDSLKLHVQDIRRLIYDLRPLAVDQLGLPGAIEQMLDKFRNETGIRVFSAIAQETALDPLAEATVFRVAQECLSNIERHAGASQVEVRLGSTEAGLELSVSDDGRGFDPRDRPAGRGGVGLASMRERAELVGGGVSVESSPGGGCRVMLSVPRKEAEVGSHTYPAG